MRFFFYGTLLAGSDNPVASLVHQKLRSIGPARAQGVLHAIPNPQGWYPGLLTGEGVVHGWLYEATDGFGSEDLAKLDAYEDYDPVRPGASLYIREAVSVTGPDRGVGFAEAYRFNRPLPEGSRPIPGGDFRAWLAAKGLEPFRGLREA